MANSRLFVSQFYISKSQVNLSLCHFGLKARAAFQQWSVMKIVIQNYKRRMYKTISKGGMCFFKMLAVSGICPFGYFTESEWSLTRISSSLSWRRPDTRGVSWWRQTCCYTTVGGGLLYFGLLFTAAYVGLAEGRWKPPVPGAGLRA